MIHIQKHGVILEKTKNEFENEGVLNPAVILNDGMIHMFYRAVREGNHSTVGYCRLNTPFDIIFRMNEPLIFPDFEFESQGVEDPRIVKIEDTFYLTYTAYDGINALGAIATSIDMIHWVKKGIIVPQITYAKLKLLTETNDRIDKKYLIYDEHKRSLQDGSEEALMWNKNLILFPRRIDGKFCFFHRIKPDIQILVAIDELSELTAEFWDKYMSNLNEHVVMKPFFAHEKDYIGGGCPPIETEDGWLIIYHGVHNSDVGYVYSACAALLDLKNPQIEIARLPYPLFYPEFPWELKGEVNNVCFPTGAIVLEEILYIYYGAADEHIACASVNINLLIEELLLNPSKSFSYENRN